MPSAYAGFNGLTIHSRANCFNNESITWDMLHARQLRTITYHFYKGQLEHKHDTGWRNTWRSAAVCWSEAKPGSGWIVIGGHWQKSERGEVTMLGTESIKDCSLYNGWWKFNKYSEANI